MKKYIVIFILPFVACACYVNENHAQVDHSLDSKFGDYWYQGKAELANYELQQVRYGEVRNGHAVLIFVTEDFSGSKHVKLDYPIENDIVKVMKLNSTRKFNTGIYPYSTMTSVFTPIYLNRNPGTLKLTTSLQEWCGHTFLQANLKKGNYEIQGNSYFESEGDQQYKVGVAMMEDEIWTRIRLHPSDLPTGEFQMFPGSLFCRFKHVPFKPATAKAKLSEEDGSNLTYHIEYKDLKRSLKIVFNKEFPHTIRSWEEVYPERGGNNGELMTTRGMLTKAIQLDYWNKNKVSDDYWRSELGLK